MLIDLLFKGTKCLSVANGLDFYGQEETKEMETFVWMFDKFFDCLNVQCTTASAHRRKPDLRPYRSPDDPRLKVHEHYFIT